MELRVELIANFNGIKAEQWEQAYGESLQLIAQFPSPLERLAHQDIGGRTLCVYSDDIRQLAGTGAEWWSIAGDKISGKHAEDFHLYRSVNHYVAGGAGIRDEDILFHAARRLTTNDRSVEPVRIFDGNTEGYPYHLAILAVGILLESRFPTKVHLSGDINRALVDKLLPWINTVLDNPVSPPICIDSNRLFGRLSEIYNDRTVACSAFMSIIRGSFKEALAELLSCENKEFVMSYCRRQLHRCAGLKERAAVTLLRNILDCTQDLPQLIELVQQVKRDKVEGSESAADFQLVTLLDALMCLYITLPKEDREPVRTLAPTARVVLTGGAKQTFARSLGILEGPTFDVDFYLPSASLLAIFEHYEPENRSVFEAAINAGNAMQNKQLNIARDTIKELLDAGSARAPRQWNTVEDHEESSLPVEEFLRREVHAQVEVVP